MCLRKSINYFFLISFLVSNYAFSQNNQNDELATEGLNYSGKQSAEWESIQNQLGAMKSKIDVEEALVKNLITEKKELSNNELTLKMNELKSAHLKLEKMLKNYNELSTRYQTQFPERGVKENRTYSRIKVKSLKTYEADMSLDGQVKRLHKKVLSQYPHSIKKIDSKNQNGSKNTNVQKGQSQQIEKDVTDAVIFKK